MEIQNLKRRNSEYALIELQREHESQWQQEAIQSKPNVREYICDANWRWRTMFIKRAMQEVAEKLKNWKRRCLSRGKYRKTTKIGRTSCEAWSGITNSESVEWSATKITRMIGIYWRLNFFYDLGLLSSYDLRTFLIKFLLLRVQESLVAKLECCEIHERKWYHWKCSWLSTCSTRCWWITQRFKKVDDIIGDSENSRNWE